MILNSNVADVFTSGVSNTEQFKFSNSPIIFKILSDSLYADKITSIVRELSSNARDAHIAAGKANIPFEIHLPSGQKFFNNSDGYVFSVKDYGTGLSEEEIYNLYTVYGESNKRHSNDFVGGFGIGSKSPFAYTDSFTVISRYNGVSTTYSAFINANGFPSITKVFSKETSEENGLEISFRVNPSDSSKFYTAVREELVFFEPFPIIKGGVINQKVIKYITKGDGWFVAKAGHWYNDVYAIIGNIPYRIHNKDFTTNNFHKDGSIYINFEVGELDLSASRESIALTEKTKCAINNKIRKVKTNIVKTTLEHIADKSRYERFSYVNSLPFIFSTFAGIDGADELSKNVGKILLSEDDINELCSSTKTQIHWFSNNRWDKVRKPRFIFPHNEKKILYVSHKISLQNISSWLKTNNISYACVIRYRDESVIEKMNELLHNPSFVKNPDIKVETSCTKTDNKLITYRVRTFTSGSIYNIVEYADICEDTPENLINRIKNSSLVLTYWGTSLTGGDDWTTGEVNSFATKMQRIYNLYDISIAKKFGEIILLSKTSYQKMKKYGIVANTYTEAMEVLNSFVKNNLEYSNYNEYACKYTSDVSRIAESIVKAYSKEELKCFIERNTLFNLCYNLYDILSNREKSKRFYEYSQSVLDNSVENEYTTYISSEPIFEFFKTGFFDKNIIRKCFAHYLGINF